MQLKQLKILFIASDLLLASGIFFFISLNLQNIVGYVMGTYLRKWNWRRHWICVYSKCGGEIH